MIIFSFDASIFETLKETYNDKYEYILPEIYMIKAYIKKITWNLDFTNKFENFKLDTNKTQKFY